MALSIGEEVQYKTTEVASLPFAKVRLVSSIKGQSVGTGAAKNYVVVETEWKNGDLLELNLPMEVEVQKWPANHDAVSIQRGPLTYSLKIGERYVRQGGTDKWPAYEIHPTTDWNYGLTLDKFEVKKKPMPTNGQPFDVEAAPVEIKTGARKIPEWTMDRLGLVGLLQSSPAKTNEREETVTLVPMGAARLRIASFPTVTTGSDGTIWKTQPHAKPALPASASFVSPSDTLDALSDGLTPESSDDQHIPRFTWWDHKGTTEWVQYELPAARAFTHADVYWFDDEPTNGECRTPESWKLLYDEGGQWREVKPHHAYGTAKDQWNSVEFDNVKSSKFRIAVKLRKGFSGGLLEWALH